jgi:hypothetical protein
MHGDTMHGSCSCLGFFLPPFSFFPPSFFFFFFLPSAAVFTPSFAFFAGRPTAAALSATPLAAPLTGA